jgi:Flp pilus assembly protein TadG
MTKRTGVFKRAQDCEAGIAALEFALVTPFLLALTIATVDLGVGFYRNMQVQNAADSGATYASFRGFTSAADVANAITTATTFPVRATPAPSKFCGCPTAAGVTITACTSQCSGNVTPGTYVSSSAQGIYTPIFQYPTLPNPLTFQATALVRLR